MKLVTFKSKGYTSIGAIIHSGRAVYHDDDAKIIDLHQGYCTLASEEGHPRPKQLAEAVVPRKMEEFMLGGEESLNTARRVVERYQQAVDQNEVIYTDEEQPIIYQREDVALLAPLRRPPRIVCLSHNYQDFIEETGVPVPPEPRIFSKYFNAICGPEDPIIYPQMTEELGYEAELAFVVGKKGRYIPAEEAYKYIAGYTILNDVSASDLTVRDKISVLRGKTFDHFAPCGPWIVTKDEIGDCHKLHIECRVNGKVLQRSNTENLIYNVPELISFLSKIYTLEPGDIVATGTPGGLAKHRNPKAFMHAGDECEIEIEKIGILKNKVVEEQRLPN